MTRAWNSLENDAHGMTRMAQKKMRMDAQHKEGKAMLVCAGMTCLAHFLNASGIPEPLAASAPVMHP
jgi:hypothetical protein